MYVPSGSATSRQGSDRGSYTQGVRAQHDPSGRKRRSKRGVAPCQEHSRLGFATPCPSGRSSDHSDSRGGVADQSLGWARRGLEQLRGYSRRRSCSLDCSSKGDIRQQRWSPPPRLECYGQIYSFGAYLPRAQCLHRENHLACPQNGNTKDHRVGSRSSTQKATNHR